MTPAHDALPNHQNNANTNLKPEGDQNSESSHAHHIATDDLALENAIGDAFKQFAMLGQESSHDTAETSPSGTLKQGTTLKESAFPLSETKDHHFGNNAADRDMDLGNVVDSLFSSLYTEDNPEITPHDADTDCHDPERTRSIDAHPKTVKEDKSHSSLEASSGGHFDDVKDVQEAVRLDANNQANCTKASGPAVCSNHSEAPGSSSANASADEHELKTTQDTSDPLVLTSTSKETYKMPPSSSPETSEREFSRHVLERDVLEEDSVTLRKYKERLAPSPSSVVNGDDLESAIGDAFNSFASEMAPVPQVSAILKNTPAETLPDVKDEGDDTNLEEAIGAAFRSLASDLEQHSSHSQDQNKRQENTSWDTSQSREQHKSALFHTIDESRSTDMAIDLGDIVQSVVLQIGSLDHPSEPTQPDLSSISKDVLQNLASEISNQVHTQEPSNLAVKEKNTTSQLQVPLDDVSHGIDQSEDLDAALKAAVANAVKSAFPGGDTTTANLTHLSNERELDLEQSQMSEILQNAFNMAMQNPQDLLTSLDAAHELEAEISETSTKSNTKLFSSVAPSTPGPGRKLHDRKDEPRLIAHLQKEQTSSNLEKPLSIAQTLALHRSNMSSSQRDYSTIKSLEDSIGPGTRASFQPSSQIHPQLLTILSSLSQHIQSGTHSSNLMLVIRQMTNALMLNKKFPASYNKAALEAIKQTKNSPDKTFYVHRLQETNRYIFSMTGDESRRKALAFICNIIASIDTRKQNSTDQNPIDQPLSETFTKKMEEDLAQFYDVALATLSGLDIQRLRMVINGVKPEVDSNEHKTKVREGNRERKKKWREINAERNKDNDLRCRVLKRAALKFGEGSSDEKLEWIEKEYIRRRMRRLNRQKKDEVKAESPPPSEEPPSQHPVFVKRLSEMFNLVTECGYDEDPSGVFMATASTIAVVACVCAGELGMNDPLLVSDQISLILSSIFDQSMRSGSARKYLFLVRREDNQFAPTSLPEISREELFRKIPGLKTLNSSSGSTLNALRESQKRLDVDFLNPQEKRHKRNDEAKNKEAGITTMEDDENLFVPTSSIHPWSTTSGLKMPLYKTPGNVTDPELFKVDNFRRDFVEPIPKIASPFISNKLGNELVNNSGKSVKKSGNLQRPGFSKPTNKPSNIGFPTLYSTSFRLN